MVVCNITWNKKVTAPRHPSENWDLDVKLKLTSHQATHL